MPGRGRTIAVLSATLGLVTLAAAAILFQDALRENIHKLETGSLEEKIAAARRLGELGSARAAPALIEAFRVLCVEGEGAEFRGVFQDALLRMGKPALPALVRAVPWAVSMTRVNFIQQRGPDGEGELDFHRFANAYSFYSIIHETIEANYLGKTPPQLSLRIDARDLTDLRRILESLRDDALASRELRQAAAESLKAFP